MRLNGWFVHIMIIVIIIFFPVGVLPDCGLFPNLSLFQAFSPIRLPSLSYLNIQGNQLENNPADDLFRFLGGFPCLQSLEVILLEISMRL